MNPAINIRAELDQVNDYWSPRIIGLMNGQYIKVAKLRGELVWHKHDDEDELFQIVKGQLVMRYENGAVTLNEGDIHVVPRGIMHNPLAEEECWIVLIETTTTKHTGDVISERTKSIEDQLGGQSF
jgi:mannose-6-phosphate isomerase-like protein (cupin superfamily)